MPSLKAGPEFSGKEQGGRAVNRWNSLSHDVGSSSLEVFKQRLESHHCGANPAQPVRPGDLRDTFQHYDSMQYLEPINLTLAPGLTVTRNNIPDLSFILTDPFSANVQYMEL